MIAELELFLTVVERGSLAAAARTLDVAPSTISKRLAALESRLGARLLHRTTRRLSMTPEGRACYEEAERLVGGFKTLVERLSRQVDEPAGFLRITTIHSFGQLQLAQMLPRFHARYPEIRIEVSLSDHLVDLVDDGFDIAIRFGVLTDSSLRARKLGTNHYYACAAPSYLDARGRPAHPAELVEHACIIEPTYPPLRRWVFEHAGERVSIEPEGILASEDPLVRFFAAVGGMGVTVLPEYLLKNPIGSGELEVLFPDQPLDLGQIWALHVSRDHVPTRIAVFLDFVTEELSQGAVFVHT